MSELDKDNAHNLYRQMLLVRRFEEACDRLYKSGNIRGFCHLYIGEEAVAVGAISALRDDDYVITHYRDHGHALTRGMDPRVVMSELMGKVTGSSRGKGGSMHLFDIPKRFMGGYAIVGGQMPIAVGMALAIQYRKENNLVLCFFGDGAVNEGEFHESLNLASLWGLPVVFLLENNLYGMGTHVSRSRAGGEEVYMSADAYNVAAIQVDGMDVMAVREAIQEASERVRLGKGPVFVEAMCYRFVGHSVQDPLVYRDPLEVEKWRAKDPIKTFKERCLAEGVMDSNEMYSVDEEVDGIIADAIGFAEESAMPGTESLYENVYNLTSKIDLDSKESIA